MPRLLCYENKTTMNKIGATLTLPPFTTEKKIKVMEAKT
jgi:hypothetical protein